MSHPVNSKVVCVDADFSKQMASDPKFHEMFPYLPENKVTYTVRTSEAGAIRLEEIVNPEGPINLGDRQNPVNIWDEGAFASERFAPLLENRDSDTNDMLNGMFKDIENDPEVMPYIYEPAEDEELVVY